MHTFKLNLISPFYSFTIPHSSLYGHPALDKYVYCCIAQLYYEENALQYFFISFFSS